MSARFIKFNLIGLGLAAAIFALIISRLDWEHLANLSQTIDGKLAGAAVSMMVLQIIFLAARWDVLINLDRPMIPATIVYRMCFVSSLTNFVFLTSVSGMALRLALAVQGGVPWVRAVCATLIDRFFSLGVLLFIVAVCLPFTVYYTHQLPVSVDVPVMFAVMIACGVAVLGFIIRHPRWVQNIVGLRRFRKTQYYLLRLLRGSNLGKAFLYSFAAQFCFFMGVFFILRASGAEITFFNMMLVVPLISLLSSLPISIAGWGVREGLFVVAMPLLHVPAEIGFMAALQVGFYTMFAAMIVGIPPLFDRHFKVELRRVISSSRHTLEKLKKS